MLQAAPKAKEGVQAMFWSAAAGTALSAGPLLWSLVDPGALAQGVIVPGSARLLLWWCSVGAVLALFLELLRASGR